MEHYEFLGRIGEGAHGVVSKARHMDSGDIVALKKIAMKKVEDGIPNQVIREIKALQQLESPYVVKMRDVFPHGNGFVLVFDYMLSDLSEVIRNVDQPLTESQIKSYMLMLLKGVACLHDLNILHRDLKPHNLLISSAGVLKIADFGLARLFWGSSGERQYSHQVATRWYRSPELLYGARVYGKGMDLWAVGAVFGEMFNCSPLFPGSGDIEQLSLVLKILGSPTKQSWPGVEDLPDFKKIDFPHYDPVPLAEFIPDATPLALDLLKRFLVYKSNDRISANEALTHEYFFTESLPSHHSELPIPARSTKKSNHFQQYHEYSTNINLDEVLPNISLMSLFTPPNMIPSESQKN